MQANFSRRAATQRRACADETRQCVWWIRQTRPRVGVVVSVAAPPNSLERAHHHHDGRLARTMVV